VALLFLAQYSVCWSALITCWEAVCYNLNNENYWCSAPAIYLFLFFYSAVYFSIKTISGIRMHARGLEGKNQFPFYSILYQLLQCSCLDSTFCSSILTVACFIPTMQWLATLCTQNSIGENFFVSIKMELFIYYCLLQNFVIEGNIRVDETKHSVAQCIINTDISTWSYRSHMFVERLGFINSDKNLWTIISSNISIYWPDCVGSRCLQRDIFVKNHDKL
jgi:hypothetical protein